MAAMSDYLEAKFAQFMFKGNPESFAPPGDDLWLALFTAATGLEANAPTSEVTGGSYGRVRVTMAEWDQADGMVENLVDVVWPTATAGWGSISHVAVMDSSTPATGNVLYHGGLISPRVIDTGDQFRLDAGDFIVEHD